MKKSPSLIAILILILLSSCIFFQNINQPSKSLPNDIITVSLHTTTEGARYEIHAPFFGVCLPIGWTVPGDSIQCNGVYNELIYYDDSLSIAQNGISPAPTGYYWWVGKGLAVSTVSGNVYAVLSIQTDNQIGFFSIDYMLGESYNGVNQQRSDNHQIEIVDDEFSPRRLQAEVQGSSVMLNWEEPLNTTGLVGYNIYRDEVKINTGIVANTIFYDANPVEGIHYYKIASYYNNGNEYMIPYDKSVVYQSIYVSPNGSNANNGSSFSDALQTIGYAMSFISADSLHPITIYLAPGYYSPYTNEELFPITCLNNVSIIGSGASGTILSAGDEKDVIQIIEVENSIIDGLTLTGGREGAHCSSSDVILSNLTISENAKHGITCSNSNITLENVNVINNNGSGINCNSCNLSLLGVNIQENTWYYGGGINCDNSMVDIINSHIINNKALEVGYGRGGGISCSNSHLNLENVSIINNYADARGGGISTDSSNVNLSNVLIMNNTAENDGGGIVSLRHSVLNFDSTNLCNVYLNQAFRGNDIYSDTSVNVVVDKFTVLEPTCFHVFPFEYFSFNISEGFVTQEEANLYVSRNGNNLNSGLTENEPLKTIHRAFSKILADSLHPQTIHLLEGTYSHSSNEELLPLNILDYVSISGEADSIVILDAERLSSVIKIYSNITSSVSKLTVKNGETGIDCESSTASFDSLIFIENAKGILCSNSNPSIKNMVIKNNERSGIWCSNSSPVIENVTLANNDGHSYGGGITCTDNSNPKLINVSILNNTTPHWGGGVSLWASNPTFENVIISGNIGGTGAGIYCRSSSPILKNVAIINNIGGGIVCERGASNIIFKNCILWNNSSGNFNFGQSDTVTISYSDIQDGINGINGNGTIYWLEGNINSDPLLGSGDHPFILSNGSPCIDAGNPDTVCNDPEDPNNLGFALWPAMGTIRNDMGAYGGPNAASWNIIVTAIEDDETEEIQTPTEFELAQNYPNPFNPTTTIQYSIKERSSVEIVLYDILGSEVEVLVNEEQDAGYYKINFNAGRLASGIYLYRLQAGAFVETKKMVLIK